MHERRFETVLTWVLLVGALAYAVRMITYPANAGTVPAVVALVMAATLVIQLVLQRRSAAETEGASASTHGVGSSEPAPEANEPEPDTYDTLLALRGDRRRKFCAITGFTVLYVVGVWLAGFVLASGVGMAAILLYSREKMLVAALGALVGAATAYGFVSFLLRLPVLDGVLFG